LKLGHVDAADQVAARRRDVEAAEDVQHRALAAAGAAHDGHVVALLDRERHTLQDVHLERRPRVVDLVDVVEQQDGLIPAGPGHRLHRISSPSNHAPPVRLSANPAAGEFIS
jgi:hypothetical protein